MKGLKPWKPTRRSLEIVAMAGDVLDEAAASGYRFTLRRVFYALVSRNVIPNTERAYKSLSVTLDRARWEDLISPFALDDRGRVTQQRPSWTSQKQFIRGVVPQYRTDWWYDHEPYVELWAEKDAVTGIIAPVASEFGVTYLAMRGFGSFTAVHSAVQRIAERQAKIIYVGDFDPSGLEMDRDLQSRLDRMGANHTELLRVALTRGQVDSFNLLPQPTKMSDSRARHWPHEGSWELDALDADILVRLVRNAITEYLPSDFEERKQADEDEREDLLKRMLSQP